MQKKIIFSSLAIAQLGWSFLTLLIIFFVMRITFSFWHLEKLHDISAYEWFFIFLNGLRFDLAALSPFLLLLGFSLFFNTEKIKKFIFVFALTCCSILILLNLVDTVLVDYTGRRFSMASLVLVGEGRLTNLLSYPLMSIVTLFCWSLLIFIYLAQFRKKTVKNYSFKNKSVSFFVLLILCTLFARGGLQMKPLSFVDSKILPHPFVHQVVLNSVFTLFFSIGKKKLEKQNYFENAEMLKHLNLSPNLLTKSDVDQSKISPDFSNQNVVIFILESFSQEYFSHKNTPFLYSLKENGLFFERAFSNGRRSIEGIAALFAGIPALMETPFVSSEYSTNEYIGLGTLFKNKGYHTSFFHGAENGSMRFDLFTKNSGFDHYFGKKQFPDQTLDDGSWGIYDEPFLQYSCEMQSQFSKPFLSSVFTLTSHHPYKVPEKFKPTLKDSSHPILPAIEYTDSALANYFACAKQKDWFRNTVFIFVGDHTGPALNSSASFVEKFRIIFGFYSPEFDFKKILSNDQYAQQIDLIATLNDLFKLKMLEENHLSRSLMKPGQKSIALYSDQVWEMTGDAPNLDLSLKAVKQYFSQSLIDNRLYYPINFAR